MPIAYSTAADLRFPDRCVRCDAAPKATHVLEASRGIDLIVFAVYESLSVHVPVCTACKRHRRWRGIALFCGALMGIILLTIIGFVVAQTRNEVAGGVLVFLSFALAILFRMRSKSFIEWNTLGLDIDLLKGADRPLRLRFRREELFTAWRAVNPGASLHPVANVAAARG